MAQGYPVEANVLFQDNSSAMKLESNGRASAGKRSRHLDIKHFYVTDQVERGLVSIEYCPTDQMVADYGTKALQGKPFSNHWSFIMNLPQVSADVKAVCHMMRARDQLPWEVESDSNDSKEEDVYDTGPSAVDDLHWTDDPNLRTGEYLLDSGTPILLRPTAPYHYGDALREKIIHEVLSNFC